jgi:hypothetical protein
LKVVVCVRQVRSAVGFGKWMRIRECLNGNWRTKRRKVVLQSGGNLAYEEVSSLGRGLEFHRKK